MTQSIAGTIAGLFSACQTLYAAQAAGDGSPVYVCLGHPGSYQPAEFVGVAMDVREPIARPTMGTNRSREKTAEIDVVISVFVPGMIPDDVSPSGTQVDALNRACALSDSLEAYFRVAGNETFGGACRESWVSNIAGPAMGELADKAGHPIGRVAELTLTVTAAIRY
jgi:hypothetical protein